MEAHPTEPKRRNVHEENHSKDLPAGRRDRYHALCEAALRRGALLREQYKKTLSNAKAAFLRNPLREVRYMTREGMLTIVFQPD